MKAVIIDGYIDEPAAFGVPPYISPKMRYMAGALIKKGYKVLYHTIDRVRQQGTWDNFGDSDLLLIHGGITTPGRYIGGSPISFTEIKKLLEENPYPNKIVTGPLVKGYSLRGGTKTMHPVFEKADLVFGNELDFLKFLGYEQANRYELLDEVYEAGAEIIHQHPNYPDLMVEFDISSGCERTDGFCSFCTESLLYGRFESRGLKGIERELIALKNVGVKAMRFGRSANVLAYGYDQSNNRPAPDKVEELFKMAREIVDPDVLHIDNGNPIFISNHKEESKKILETIARYDSPGDTVSFGIESFDSHVRELNNLGGTIEDLLYAIRLVNEIGSKRVDGIPKLLPGLNLLYGLPGQTDKTYGIDRETLKKIYDEHLMIRRLNIRQVMVFENTKISGMELPKIKHKKYELNREAIRKEFDLPMLKRVFPVGSVIRNVIPEFSRGEVSFGRPLGTYPILVGTPSKMEQTCDMVIVDHGMRSVTGLPLNSDLNKMTERELRAISGIGKDRARNLILARPFNGMEDIEKVVGAEVVANLKKIKLTFGGR